MDNGDNTYPFAGGLNSVEAIAWYSHLGYETGPWFAYDVGVVILEEPGVVGLEEYGALPDVDQLEEFKTGRDPKGVTFTSVGYGLQRVHPFKTEADRVCMAAYPFLIQINVPGVTGDFSLLLSNNHSTGGVCFGDSGGSNFLEDTNIVAGVTSFGLNGQCAGTGGVFRIAKENVLNFIDWTINQPIDG